MTALESFWSQYLPVIAAPVAGAAVTMATVAFDFRWQGAPAFVGDRPRIAARTADTRGAPVSLIAAGLSLSAAAIAQWAILAEPPAGVWISCLFGWWLIALSVVDMRQFVLPDLMTVPLAAAGLAFTFLATPDRVIDHAIGMVAGFAVLALVREVYGRARGREGLGLGDAKLLAAIGAWLGWHALPGVVLLAALGGIALILARTAFGYVTRPDQALPFGPFLAIGAWIIWLHGEIAFA